MTTAKFATPNIEDNVDAGINLTSADEKGKATIKLTVPDPPKLVKSWISLDAEKIDLNKR